MFFEDKRIHNKITSLHHGSHGSIDELSKMLDESSVSLKRLIENMPNTVKELDILSSKAGFDTYKLWKNVCEKSFNYMKSVADFYDSKLNTYNSSDEAEYYRKERQNKDNTRKNSHEALISSINPWLRSLSQNGVDTNFLKDVIIPGNRLSYGDFGLSIAAQLYISE